MSWSETMLIIQHFYNVFDIDNRLTNVEYKMPLLSKSVDGKPELPEDTSITDLTPGTLWFIPDENNEGMVEAISVLQSDHTFAKPLPFKVDLKKLTLPDEILQIIQRMDLTATNFYDIIKVGLEILEKVPVKYGGTGLSAIEENKLLLGGKDNTLKTVGLDTAPTQRSENFVNSGALFEALKKLAEKNHASTTKDYGVGSQTQYGHLRVTDDYETIAEDMDIEKTTVSLKGINALYKKVQASSQLFHVLENGELLFSSVFTAYRPQGMKDDTLKLIDSYYSIEPNMTGDFTLIIN